MGEIFVHGWDLAKSTGQKVPPDQGVADALLSSEWPSMCADVRNGDPSVFAPEIHVPREAPAIDRLVGFLGRDPSWPGGRQPSRHRLLALQIRKAAGCDLTDPESLLTPLRCVHSSGTSTGSAAGAAQASRP